MGRARGTLGCWILLLALASIASMPRPARALAVAADEVPSLDARVATGGPLDAEIRGASSPRSLLSTPARNTKAKPEYDTGLYMSKTSAMAEVKRIVAANPSTMRLDTMQSTRGGYSSELVVVTVEPAGLDSGDPAERQRKTRVLYNYGEHGRELITVEVAVQLLRELARGVDEASSLAHASAGTRAQTRAALLASVFKIVPMENVNGRAKVEGGDLCERKNGRGVDCNRNWAVDWGVKAPDYDPYEEYPGTAPFSEPEAFMLKTLLEEFQPHAWVNVHSGMEALFLPYDHKAAEPEGPGADVMRDILRGINAAHCGGRCVVGGGGKGVGYLAHGTATDYVFVSQRVPVAFTWEIYGDQQAHYLDCFRMFNPMTRAGRDEVVAAWVAAGVSLAPMLRHHPEVPIAAAMERAGVDPTPGTFGGGRAMRVNGGGLRGGALVGGDGAAASGSGSGSGSGWGSRSEIGIGIGMGSARASGGAPSKIRRLDDAYADRSTTRGWFANGSTAAAESSLFALALAAFAFCAFCVAAPRWRRARFLARISREKGKTKSSA